MYGVYYDLPLDYAGLMFDEMVGVVKEKMKKEAGTNKKQWRNPKNLSYPIFFSLLLGDDSIDTSATGQPLPNAENLQKSTK